MEFKGLGSLLLKHWDLSLTRWCFHFCVKTLRHILHSDGIVRINMCIYFFCAQRMADEDASLTISELNPCSFTRVKIVSFWCLLYLPGTVFKTKTKGQSTGNVLRTPGYQILHQVKKACKQFNTKVKSLKSVCKQSVQSVQQMIL